MRILLVSNYFLEHMGGIETVADNLVRGYRRRGHRVIWAAAQVEGLVHAGHPDDLPLPAWNLTEKRFGFPYPLLAPQAYARLLTAIRESDVVHVHDCLYQASVFAAFASRRLIEAVMNVHHIAFADRCEQSGVGLGGQQRIGKAEAFLGQVPGGEW